MLDPSRHYVQQHSDWHPAYVLDRRESNGLMWAAGNGHLPVVEWLLSRFSPEVGTWDLLAVETFFARPFLSR